MRENAAVRVLFSSLGAIGHIHPLVPMAGVLQARGHDVRWATGPESCAWVEKAGIPAVPAGQTQVERLAEFWRRYPETRERPPQEWPDVMFPKMFGEISAPLALADLLPLVRDWRPCLGGPRRRRVGGAHRGGGRRRAERDPRLRRPAP